MHSTRSLRLLCSFGNSTEPRPSHSGLLLPPVRSPHPTFTLTQNEAEKEGRQRCGNANPQTPEMPGLCHVVLGPGAPGTAAAGLGAADGKRGWAEDFAKIRRLRETLLGHGSPAGSSLLNLPAVEGGAAQEAVTKSSDYLLKRPTRAFHQPHPKKGNFTANLTEEFLTLLWDSTSCYLITLRLLL